MLFSNKRLLVAAIILVVLGIVALVVFQPAPEEPVAPVVVEEAPVVRQEVLGKSVEGRSIVAYTFGTGSTTLLFVGGIHGGYEWNSVLLAYEFVDHFTANPQLISDSLAITVIPSANPDGVFKIIGKEGRFLATEVPDVDQAPGRFNARGVDLNRNFDCKWQAESTWRGATVSAGSAPFSEPEAAALRDFALREKPVAVVFWHSQANAVYASECEDGILPETLEVMNRYAGAAGYPSVDSFDAYPVSGDAEGWLASIGIPAVTVELKTHESIEWEKNLLGVTALLDLYR